MARVWLYILGAIKDPDHVACVVPWRVDEDLIFFGPCMNGIRKSLRKQFLSLGTDCRQVTEDLYMVGVNGCNAQRVRKVVWAGKLSQVMTFAEADRRLKGSRFEKMRSHWKTPLHVKRLPEVGRLEGYEHVGKEHLDRQKWIYDLSTPASIRNGYAQVEGQRLKLAEGVSSWEGFDLDICMLLENLFFARGRGIDFDEEALAILREAPPKRPGIDRYAIFGLTASGRVNPRRGNGLLMEGDFADRFIGWLRRRAAKVADDQGDEDVPPEACCD